VQEVGGAVERVDQPVPVGREPAALLADERDVRGGIDQKLAIARSLAPSTAVT
jgi:hypothetical protein